MINVRKATCGLKDIQGPTPLRWESIRKSGRTWSAFEELMRGTHLPMGSTKVYNVDPGKNVHSKNLSICGVLGCLFILDSWCYRDYIIPTMVYYLRIPQEPLVVPYFLDGYRVLREWKFSSPDMATMRRCGVTSYPWNMYIYSWIPIGLHNIRFKMFKIGL